MTPVVVYGAGGMGREVAETILAVNGGQDWSLMGFLDDDAGTHGTQVLGLPVLGPGEWILDNPGVKLALGIGHPHIRYKVVHKMRRLGGEWATVIHPAAVVSPSAEVGQGCVVFAGCTVSTNARLGAYSYLNYRAVVSHDAVVDDFACIMAQVGLSGNVNVGEGSFIGVGTATRQQVSIGEWSIVGAGASVVRDIPSYCVAVGVPAAPIRSYASREDMPPF